MSRSLLTYTATAHIQGIQRILDGATIHVYEKGTSTPVAATLWNSDTGGSGQANPFISPANGTISFWLDSPQFVDVVVAKPGFATLRETVAVGDPAGGVDVTTFATPTPTASKVPQADGSGKLAAGWLQEALSFNDLIDNHFQMLAAPSGIAATDSALFGSLTTGRTHQLRSGTYVLNATTLSTANVRFIGEPHKQTTIQLVSQGGGSSTHVVNVAASNITFENIVFDGNVASIGAGTNNYWSGLLNIAGGVDNVTFLNCTFQNTARSAIYANGTTTRIRHLTVQGCKFTSIGKSGAGNGGACIMFDGGVHYATISGNEASGTLSSNFLKAKETYLPSESTTYTVQSGTTATSIIVNGTPFGTSDYSHGATIRIVSSSNATLVGQERAVVSNTNNTATTLAFTAVPAAGDTVRLLVKCAGVRADDNLLDYTSCTAFDGTYAALGIEIFHGTEYAIVTRNRVFGPHTVPSTGYFWGISISGGRGVEVAENQVVGGDSAQAMGYGIEVAESEHAVLSHNHIKNCDIGSNFTNNNPSPAHNILIDGNQFENCFSYGIVSDSAPGGFTIANNKFVDCGKRYVWFNNARVGGGNGTILNGLILGCTFQIKDQTALDGEGQIFGIYITSTNETDDVGLTIGNCLFVPHPEGTSTRCLLAINGNKPRGVRIHHCHFDGLAPDGSTKSLGRPIVSASGDWHVDHCFYNNFTGGAGLMSVAGTEAHPLSTAEFNLGGSGNTTTQVRGGVTSVTAFAPISSVWWSANGHLQSIDYQLNNAWAPTAAAGANAGTSPPAPAVDGTSSDRTLRVTFGTGTGPAAGAQVAVTFHKAFASTPFVVLAPNNTATEALGLYVSSRSTTGFTVSTTNAPAASQANTVYDVTARVEAI